MKRCFYLFALLMAPLLAVGGTTSSQAGPNPLIQELKSANANIRARAARDLGNSGDVSAVPALAASLNDPSTHVRSEVIVALEKLHTLAAQSALLKATEDTDPGVRELAVEAVVGWYTGEVPALGFKSHVATSYHQAMGWFQGNASSTVGGAGLSPEVINALETAMMDTRSIQAARRAAWGLGVLRARAAVPDLIKAAHSDDDALADNSLNALAKIQDITAGPQIVDLLDSASNPVKQTAAVTVGVLRTKTAVPKLEDVYKNDANDNNRRAALDGLAYTGDPSAYPIFLQALSSKDAKERTYAAEGLARAGNSQALPALQKRMVVEKKEGVKLAIEFAETSLGEQQRLSDLVNALSSRSYGDVAQSYLIELTRKKPLLQALCTHLNDRNATVRLRLCNVLAVSGDTSTLARLQPLTRDGNGDVAAAALHATQDIRARME